VNREPLITRASITAIGGVIVTLLISFGVDLSQEQTAALAAAVAVAAPFLVAALTRPKVEPTEFVAAREDGDGVLVAGPAAVQADGAHVAVVDEAV